MDALVQDALGLWPGLAKQMGVDPRGWRAKPLARRVDGRVTMIVLLLEGAERSLVLKHRPRPVAPEKFLENVQNQMTAHDAFPKGAPAVHAVDTDAQALVMDFVPGVPLAVALDGVGRQAQAEALCKAGAWLDGFHRATHVDSRVFQPKYTLRFLADIIREVETGQRGVTEPARFLQCARALVAEQAGFEGQRTYGAITHGDLHMRNIMIDRTAVGIDFAGGHAVPVGHDIARLLADYAILRAPHDDIAEGAVLPAYAEQAFFAGYTFVGPEDPGVRLLTRHRVLAEWWGVPAKDRSQAQARRLAGVLSLASRVWPQ